MKETWKRPVLEVLDVSMTMKWPDDGNDNAGGDNPDPEDPLGS